MGGSPGYWPSSCVVAFPPTGGGSPGAAPPYNHYSPSVAFVGPSSGVGTDDGSGFMVSHFTHGGSQDVVFAEITGYGTPTQLSGGNYYWASDYPAVNNSSADYSASAPCGNNISSSAIVAWLSKIGGSNFDIHYNISGCCYSFKPAEQRPGTNSAKTDEWKVYPNPATDELTIAGCDCHYTITDILGRCQATGEVDRLKTLDLSKWTSGAYIIKIDGKDGNNMSRMFIKD